MTLRLSCLFEAQLKQICYNWKSTKRRSPKKKPSPSQSDQLRPGPTTRRSTATNANGNHVQDSDDDHIPLRNGRPSRRSTQYATSNGVSSSVNTEPVAGPSTSRGHPRKSRAHIEIDQSSESSSNSSSSSSDSDGSGKDSDDEPSIPLSALGTQRGRRRNSDSEESYKPNRRPMIKPKRRKKRKEDKKEKLKKSNGTVSRVGRPPKQRIVHSDEDYAVNNRNSESPKKSSGRPKRNQRARESSSSSDGEPKRRKVRKLRGYSSDNSCALNNSLVPMERNPLETDSDSQVVRPTRGRKKKTWARDADSQDEQPFNQRHRASQSSQVIRLLIYFEFFFSLQQFHLQTVQRRYPQRKQLTDSENSPEEQTTTTTTTRRTSNIFRRETRSRASQEDSEDDQTLSQVMNNFRSRSRRNFGKINLLSFTHHC